MEVISEHKGVFMEEPRIIPFVGATFEQEVSEREGWHTSESQKQAWSASRSKVRNDQPPLCFVHTPADDVHARDGGAQIGHAYKVCRGVIRRSVNNPTFDLNPD